MHTATFITLLASVVSATPYGQRFDTRAETCPVVFDGRVPSNASLTDFDKENGGGWNPYNPGFVKGNNITWSEILKLPKTKTSSRFDTAEGNLPLEVTISDESIFMKQLGFRRAGLQFNKDTNEGSPGAKGVKTLHFSIMQDASRPLNLSHEYLVSYMELYLLVRANRYRTSGMKRPISQETSSSSRPVPSSARSSRPILGSYSTSRTSFSGRPPWSRASGRTLPSPSITRRSKSSIYLSEQRA